jgi:hypothetical protein
LARVIEAPTLLEVEQPALGMRPSKVVRRVPAAAPTGELELLEPVSIEGERVKAVPPSWSRVAARRRIRDDEPVEAPKPHRRVEHPAVRRSDQVNREWADPRDRFVVVGSRGAAGDEQDDDADRALAITDRADDAVPFSLTDAS